MSIDWVTVAAQIANFLVLVWLLKRFLYRPILDGIDAREAEITARMQVAGQAEDAAKLIEAEYHDKVTALNLAEAEMSQTIRKSAEAQRDTMLTEANAQLVREQEGWQAHLDAQTRSYSVAMQNAGANALFSLTRKALIDLADETLEDRIGRHLIGKIEPMLVDVKQAAGKVAAAEITSHDALSQASKDHLTAELQEVFPATTLTFTADPAQPYGMVLRMGGVQVAWTVDSYVEGLAAMITQTLGNDPKVFSHEQ